MKKRWQEYTEELYKKDLHGPDNHDGVITHLQPDILECEVMSLLFNMLSRLVVTFLPRSKRLLISWLQSPSAVILEPRKIKSATVSTVSPSICHEVMGSDAMILVFWMLIDGETVETVRDFIFWLSIITYGRKWRRTKEPHDESERREWKSWFKTLHSKNEDYGIWSHHFMANRETMETVTDFIWGGSSTITADGDCSHEIKKKLAASKCYNQPRQHIRKQRHYFSNKGPSSQNYSFFSSHVWMWELDYKESWVLKNWCFWSVVLEKTLESPLNCKEIKSAYPKGQMLKVKDRCWSWNSNILITWCEKLTHFRRPWFGERLRAGREGDDRGWDGWMASLTQWTWFWASSRSWWWTGKPGVLQSMGS